MYRARVGGGRDGWVWSESRLCNIIMVCTRITFDLCPFPPCSRQVEDVELKPGGADIDVTESNKKEYVG